MSARFCLSVFTPLKWNMIHAVMNKLNEKFGVKRSIKMLLFCFSHKEPNADP